MRTNSTKTRQAWRAAALLVAGDLVRLAAAPTFAMMALLTAAPGDAHEMTGSIGHTASPLSGMALMYALMSVFHTAPWLKLAKRHERVFVRREPIDL